MVAKSFNVHYYERYVNLENTGHALTGGACIWGAAGMAARYDLPHDRPAAVLHRRLACPFH